MHPLLPSSPPSRPPSPLPPSPPPSPSPTQEAGVQYVLDRGGRGLIADEMGLGKTLQVESGADPKQQCQEPIQSKTKTSARLRGLIADEVGLGQTLQERRRRRLICGRRRSRQDSERPSSMPAEAAATAQRHR